MSRPFIFYPISSLEIKFTIHFFMPHYGKCDVISEQSKKFKLKYLVNKALELKGQKNLYYSCKSLLHNAKKSFRFINTLKLNTDIIKQVSSVRFLRLNN